MNSKSYNIFFVLFVFLSINNHAYAQKNLMSKFVQRFISTDKDSTKTANIMALPILAYSPETGLEYGVLGNYIFVSDQSDSLIHSSNIEFISSLTTKKQSNVKLSLNYWAPQNKFHYISQLAYKNFPFSFYGIGDQTLAEDKKALIQKLFRFNFEGDKLISKNYYAGLNVRFENFIYKNSKDETYNL